MSETTRQIERGATTENGTGGPLVIVRLRTSDDVAWTLMPHVLRRMGAFVIRLHLDTPIEIMQQWVRENWARGGDNVALWVAVKDAHVVGHAFGTIETAWGIPYAMIVHADMDQDAPLPLAQQRYFLADMTAWARSQKAMSIKMLTHRTPKGWERKTGFVFDKYLMKMELG